MDRKRDPTNLTVPEPQEGKENKKNSWAREDIDTSTVTRGSSHRKPKRGEGGGTEHTFLQERQSPQQTEGRKKKEKRGLDYWFVGRQKKSRFGLR